MLISLAVEDEHAEIVRTLLKQDDLNINIENKISNPLLLHGTVGVHDVAVGLLLE